MNSKEQNIKRRFNVKVKGQGDKALVFLHGFGCDQSMWRLIVPSFSDHFRIVLYDQMGSGESDLSGYNPDKYSTLQGYASDLIEIVEALGLDQVIVVGHSVSATIAILAAEKRPDLFERLILIGPSPCYFIDGDYNGGFTKDDLERLLSNADQDYFGWARAMAPIIMGRPDLPEAQRELTNSFCQTNPEIARQFARVLFLSDHRQDFQNVLVPCLILQCSQDVVAPESVGLYQSKKMKLSTYKKLNAVGHCPHVSAPEETVAAIMPYLKTTSLTQERNVGHC